MDAIDTLVKESRINECDKAKLRSILETLTGCSYVRCRTILDECGHLIGYLPTARTVDSANQEGASHE